MLFLKIIEGELYFLVVGMDLFIFDFIFFKIVYEIRSVKLFG